MLSKSEKRYRRHKRIRAKIKGTEKIPRLSVFRSNKHIWCQLIDDTKGHTILSASDIELEEKERKGKSKSELAYQVGKLIAEKALKKKIERIVFDRGGYKYHGRVKAVAEGAREKGLKF